ncbi:C40 family peptidase [Paenibacillus sp. GYB003]|uniref:C40 family peptidase n=1 Tax=Paenibacillus sp. GYB003 TaxID=2994392 RepID=UPI002F9673C0
MNVRNAAIAVALLLGMAAAANGRPEAGKDGGRPLSAAVVAGGGSIFGGSADAIGAEAAGPGEGALAVSDSSGEAIELSMLQQKVDQHKDACRIETPSQTSHVINTPVATIWAEPNKHRLLDGPAVSAVSDVKSWAAGMSTGQKLWLVGKLETQALYGDPAIVLGTEGEWANVLLPEQPTSRNERGYPGWLPLGQIAETAAVADLAACPTAVVASASAWLYDDPERSSPFLELSFNTRLPAVRESGENVVVLTPADGEKYLPKSDARVIRGAADQASAKPDGGQLLRTAERFLGLPYLWAGVSGFGFDCSGFTYSLYRYYGISIPRDASDQAKAGEPVGPDGLRPGDLVFFARDGGKGNVHHVGMYAGDGRMIHAPNSERSIEIVSLGTPAYAKEYAGARRYLPE